MATDVHDEDNVNMTFGSCVKSALEDSDDDSSLTLFTSENSTWLPDDNGSMMSPDLFVTNKHFAKFLGASTTEFIQNGVRIAVPIHPSFANFIFEGKNVTLGTSERGKLAFYLKLLAKYQSKSYGLLFNATNFVYMEVTGDNISLIEDGALKLPGALDYIVSKVRRASADSVASLFNAALKYFECDFDIKPLSFNSYLGGGRFGRVFKCQLTEGSEYFSIKLVKLGYGGMTENEVLREFNAFHEVYSRSPHLTMIPYEFGTYTSDGSEQDSFCAYVLAGVGLTMPPPSKKKMYEQLFRLHKTAFVHGDPRRPNIIRYKSQWRWIDFMPINDEFLFDFKSVSKDMRILYKNLARETVVPENVDQLIKCYANNIMGRDYAEAETILNQMCKG
jgi:hypothetical protein